MSRRSAPFILIIAILLAGGYPADRAAVAQRLNLGDPEPPALHEMSYASRRAHAAAGAQLRPLEDVDANVTPDEIETIEAGRRNWRRLALVLAQIAERREPTDPVASIAVLAEHTLLDNESVLDDALTRAVQISESVRRSDALWFLRRFNRRVEESSPDQAPTTVNEFDRWLRDLVQPLLEFVMVVDAVEAVESGWTTRDVSPAHALARIGRLAGRIDSLAAPESSRHVIRDSLESLRAAAAYPVYAPDVHDAVDIVERAVDRAEVIDRAEWLELDDRQRLFDGLNDLVRRVAVIPVPASAYGALQRLERLSAILEAAQTLTQSRGRLAVDVQRLAPLMEMIPLVDGDGNADVRLEALETWTRSALIFRTLPELGRSRALRQVEPPVASAYLEIESRLLDEMTSGDSALRMNDPSFVSLRSRSHDLLGELTLLREIEALPATLAGGDDALARKLTVRLNSIVSQLSDPMTHAEARTTLERFRDEAARFAVLPLEFEFASDAELTASLGDFGRLILPTIRLRRREWIDAWANEVLDARSESERMHRLRRFMEAQQAAVQLERLNETPDAMNRWSAWQQRRETMSDAIANLMNERDEAGEYLQDTGTAFAEALDDLERRTKLARLTARFAGEDAIPMWDSAKPAARSASSVLSQLIYAPAYDSPGVELRTKLAHLCRYQFEYDAPSERLPRESLREIAAFLDFTLDLALEQSAESSFQDAR